MPISSPVVWDNSRMRDDIAMTTGNSQDSGSPDVTDLGNDVYQFDTQIGRVPGDHCRLPYPVKPALPG
jgi:hypothetical protein